jgi:hypothetical protein
MLLALAGTVVTCLSLSAVDGDTIKCDGQNMRIMGPGSPNKSGVDAPEIGNARCAKERLLGDQAKLRLDTRSCCASRVRWWMILVPAIGTGARSYGSASAEARQLVRYC